MKKLLLVSLLSIGLCQAESSTIAHLYGMDDPEKHPLIENMDALFTSHHEYIVSNNTPSTQHISVCFDIVACPDYPEHLRSTRDCRAFELPAHTTKSDKKDIMLLVNYSFGGWCKIFAQTETTGGTYSIAKDNKKFLIK